jgi:glycosyltransferase involved in cell wall biosynthesis
MRIMVNASTTVVGGGAQVAANFIRYAVRDHRHEFYFIVSKEVAAHLGREELGDQSLEVDTSPSKILSGHSVRKSIRSAVKKFFPDVVFTVFGPAYQRFTVPHVCGFANPWDTHPNTVAYKTLSIIQRIRSRLLRIYKRAWLSKRDFYWTETIVSQKGLLKITGLKPESIKVIPNGYSQVFDGQESKRVYQGDSVKRVLVIGAPYPHKRFPFVAEVALRLKERGWRKKIKFYVTLPEEDQSREVDIFWKRVREFDVEEMIVNVGKLSSQECPKYYQQSDCVFLPTVLETFSASYLESMAMSRPIITSDLNFARDICEDAATYFEPESAFEAARAIERVLLDSELQSLLVRNGLARLEYFPSPRGKYETHIDWLRCVLENS